MGTHYVCTYCKLLTQGKIKICDDGFLGVCHEYLLFLEIDTLEMQAHN